VPKIKDRRIYCEGILVTVVENVSDNEEIHEEYDLFEHAVSEVIENLESSPEEDKDLEERMDMLLENHKRIMELLGTPNADWLS
jgi:predicted nuclease with TOPRIM domain